MTKCKNCEEELLDDYDDVNGVCVNCYNKGVETQTFIDLKHGTMEEVYNNNIMHCVNCHEDVHEHNGNYRKGKFYCSCCLEYNEVD